MMIDTKTQLASATHDLNHDVQERGFGIGYIGWGIRLWLCWNWNGYLLSGNEIYGNSPII